MQNLMQIHCSTHSVILNAMATQYTCSLSSIYHLHRLVQWSHHCSHMSIPVHSPWVPGYIDAVQAVLVILTMAGLFLDTSRTSRSGIAELYVNSMFFLRKCPTVFKSGCTILHPQHQCTRLTNFSTSLPRLFSSCVCVNNRHPNQCAVVSHCGFDLNFPNG